jgi:ubiquinone/menaquinone biosynthesis C-methylase UbiE
MTINVGAFDRVDSEANASAFAIWMSAQRRAMKDPTLRLLELSSNDRVLDVGCGSGHDLGRMYDAGAQAIGIDLSHAMLRVAKDAVGDHVGLVKGSGAQLPLGVGSFTAVHSRAVLLHCERPDQVVGEYARVLAPGGRLLLSEPDHGSHLVHCDVPDVADRILRHRRTTFRHPTVGRALPSLVHQVGLRVTHTQVLPIVHRSYDSAKAAGGPFGIAVRQAVEAGAITVDEARQYDESLTELDAVGSFCFIAAAVLVLAESPN